LSGWAVKVDGISKRYMLGDLQSQSSLRDALAAQWGRLRSALSGHRAMSRPALSQQFWALKGISFQVRQGEVMGILGRNGAGKSTLLKILGRITLPTEGRAEIRGRVGSLLEVGSGFNPELTGRQNIYLNGSILGMSRKEIRRRFDEIVDFSEVEQFIDTPIKHYSSGMYMRLAFSVAAHLDTEILLADEVLSVGDAAFAQKCMGKINDVTWSGRTVLFVSHNTSAVNNLCDTGIVLERGRLIYQGDASDATRLYLERSFGRHARDGSNPVRFPERSDLPTQVRALGLYTQEDVAVNEVSFASGFEVRVSIDIRRPSRDYYAFLILTDRMGNEILWSTDEDCGPALTSDAPLGTHEYRVVFPGSVFKPGPYTLTAAIGRWYKGKIDRQDAALEFEVVDHHSYRAMRGRYRGPAIIAPPLAWQLVTDAERRLRTDNRGTRPFRGRRMVDAGESEVNDAACG
jgi:lipopolysaccharide transport system ATP-binding protein